MNDAGITDAGISDGASRDRIGLDRRPFSATAQAARQVALPLICRSLHAAVARANGSELARP